MPEIQVESCQSLSISLSSSRLASRRPSEQSPVRKMASQTPQDATCRLMDLPPELRLLIWEWYIDTIECEPIKFEKRPPLQQTAIRQKPPSNPSFWLPEPHLLQASNFIRFVVVSFYLRRLKADRKAVLPEITHCSGPRDPTRYDCSSWQAYMRHCFRAQSTRLRLEIARIWRELEALKEKSEENVGAQGESCIMTWLLE